MYESNFDYWLDHRLPDDLRQRVTRSTQAGGYPKQDGLP
jgi:hypothetical protein